MVTKTFIMETLSKNLITEWDMSKVFTLVTLETEKDSEEQQQGENEAL